MDLASLGLLATLFILATIAVGAMMKGITGLGLPIFAIPALAMFVPVETAVVVMALPTLIGNIWLVVVHREHFPLMTSHRLFLAWVEGNEVRAQSHTLRLPRRRTVPPADRVLRLTNANPDHLGTEFIEAFESTGARIITGPDYVEVIAPDEIQPVSITTGIYPGFPTDLQAQWTVLLTQARGTATVTDTVYTDRFNHIPELNRLGVQATAKGETVTVEGGHTLKGAKVMSTDLRASVSLVLAGMVAEGTTDVLRIYHLDRGYERLEKKLSAAGIAIERVQYDEFAQPEPHTA